MKPTVGLAPEIVSLTPAIMGSELEFFTSRIRPLPIRILEVKNSSSDPKWLARGPEGTAY